MLWEQGVEGSNPFAPTLKIKELQAIVTSFFFAHFKKTGHKMGTLFQNISYRFLRLSHKCPAKKDTLFGKNHKKRVTKKVWNPV